MDRVFYPPWFRRMEFPLPYPFSIFHFRIGTENGGPMDRIAGNNKWWSSNGGSAPHNAPPCPSHSLKRTLLLLDPVATEQIPRWRAGYHIHRARAFIHIWTGSKLAPPNRCHAFEMDEALVVAIARCYGSGLRPQTPPPFPSPRQSPPINPVNVPTRLYTGPNVVILL